MEYPDGHITHFITNYFEARVIGGELTCSSPETLDLAYFPTNQLPTEILFMNPYWLEDALSEQQEAFIR